MERISNIFVVAAEVGWSDVGSWQVVHELRPKDKNGNVRPRKSVCLDSQGNMVFSHDKFVVTLGVRDLVIVEVGDALLVCARLRSQDVGKAVEELERRGLEKLL
jgi:mannose-1-phosphate guanylyltransferase